MDGEAIVVDPDHVRVHPCAADRTRLLEGNDLELVGFGGQSAQGAQPCSSRTHHRYPLGHPQHSAQNCPANQRPLPESRARPTGSVKPPGPVDLECYIRRSAAGLVRRDVGLRD